MDDYQPVTLEEYQRLMRVFQQNVEKSFVQRILRPNDFPVIDAGNGQVATHRMAWGQAGDKYVAYPTVLMTETGQLHDFGDEAWSHAARSGNFIEFDSPQEAEWFSKRYKGAWGGQMNKPPR